MATRIIGIDFGTSTTVVRVRNVGSGNRIVSVAVNGKTTIPTIAFRPDRSDKIYYGYDAQAQVDANVSGTFFRNFKMDLISEDETKRDNAANLVQGFLRYIYERYQIQANQGVFEPADEVKVYVSHPAKWNSYARSLMKQSVINAGFCRETNIKLKDEPTAAVLAAIHEKSDELKGSGMMFEEPEYKAMMIDMGAGTTDIVLFTYKIVNGKLQIDNIFTYPSASHPGLCGGREIDAGILLAAREFVTGMQGGKLTNIGEKVMNKMEKRITKWKEEVLSPTLGSDDVLPELGEITTFRDTLREFGQPIANECDRFTISRDSFEKMTAIHWTQWVELLTGTFREVSEPQFHDLRCPKSPEDVELLIFTGGHSQWNLGQDYLLGKRTLLDLPMLNFEKIHANHDLLLQTEYPQETVAVGLCFLDDDVVAAIPTTNDVSINFTCEGRYLGSVELVSKGVPLPYAKNDFLLKNTIKGNFIFRRELKIDYSIVTDKKNTIKKVVIVPSDGILMIIFKAVLSALGVALIDIPVFLYRLVTGDFDKINPEVLKGIIDNDYSVELSPDIKINNEGIITVGGTIKVDGEQLTIPEVVI